MAWIKCDPPFWSLFAHYPRRIGASARCIWACQCYWWSLLVLIWNPMPGLRDPESCCLTTETGFAAAKHAKLPGWDHQKYFSWSKTIHLVRGLHQLAMWVWVKTYHPAHDHDVLSWKVTNVEGLWVPQFWAIPMSWPAAVALEIAHCFARSTPWFGIHNWWPFSKIKVENIGDISSISPNIPDGRLRVVNLHHLQKLGFWMLLARDGISAVKRL